MSAFENGSEPARPTKRKETVGPVLAVRSTLKMFYYWSGSHSDSRGWLTYLHFLEAKKEGTKQYYSGWKSSSSMETSIE